MYHKVQPTTVGATDAGLRAPQRLASSAANSVLTMRFRIDLNAFVGTFLAMDRDLYFGQNLQLNIYWKTLLQCGFVSQVDGATGLTNITGASSFSNYFIYIAQEVNKENVLSIKSQVNSGGLSLLVSYTNYS